jgi:hypothetical protein
VSDSVVTTAITAAVQPVTKLIETISAGIGEVYEPFGIVRRAKAEAKAEIIRAETDVEKQEIARRAAERLVAQEVRRQENIEAVVDAAAKKLPATVSADPVDPDWTARFVDAAQDISNTQLRELFAAVLAREVTKPGSSSKRTLGILRDLSAVEANTFLLAARYLWANTAGDRFIVLTSEALHEAAYGLNYGCLLELEAIGLLVHRPTILRLVPGQVLTYYGRRLRYEPPPDPPAEQGTRVIPLTMPGAELAAVVTAAPHREYFAAAVDRFGIHYGGGKLVRVDVEGGAVGDG